MNIARALAWIGVLLAACLAVRIGALLIEPMIPTIALLIVLAFVGLLLLGRPGRHH